VFLHLLIKISGSLLNKYSSDGRSFAPCLQLWQSRGRTTTKQCGTKLQTTINNDVFIPEKTNNEQLPVL